MTLNQKMNGSMSTAWHLRLGLRVLSRTLQIFVVWPAGLLASGILVIGLTGESPALSFTDAAFEWGESTFRAAPIGSVNVNVYEPVKTLNDETAPPEIEKRLVGISTISVEMAKTEFSDGLTSWYWRLVLLGSAFMVLLMGWREFFVIPAAFEVQNGRVLNSSAD